MGHMYSFFFRPVVAVLTETPTTTPLCEFYLCLPHSGSPQVELPPRSLSCGFASDGARRTSWRPSWRGGADPGWRSAPPRWWERQKRAHDPGTRARCCIQSLWRCWESLGAPPAASFPECSAKWKHAFSCGKEDGGRKAGWWVFMGNGCKGDKGVLKFLRKRHLSVIHPFLEKGRSFVSLVSNLNPEKTGKYMSG